MTEAMNDINSSVNAYLQATVDTFDPRPSVEVIFKFVHLIKQAINIFFFDFVNRKCLLKFAQLCTIILVSKLAMGL